MFNGLFSCPVLIAAFMSNGADPLPAGPPVGSFVPQFIGQDADDEADARELALTEWVMTRSPFEKRRDYSPTKLSPQRFRGCLHIGVQPPGGVGGILPTVIVYDPACHSEYEIITIEPNVGPDEWAYAEQQLARTMDFDSSSSHRSRYYYEMVRRVHRPSAEYRVERIEAESRGEPHVDYWGPRLFR